MIDFYFVDERGNCATNFETVSNNGEIIKYEVASKRFEVGVLKINSEHLRIMQNHLNNVRYFLNLSKEFETIVSAKTFIKLWDILENCHGSSHCYSFLSHIEKEKHNGPYLYHDTHRFRIFTIYRSLCYIINCLDNKAEKAQIVIDRFSMSYDNEKNTYDYFRYKLSKYYKEVEIAFLDSRCCDYLQLIDVILTIFDEKNLELNEKFSKYETGFIKHKDFTSIENPVN